MPLPGGIRTNPELGGGTLYDLGVYCIQAARLLFGAEPFQVQAAAIDGGRAGMPGIDEMTTAVLSFEGDRTASFTTSFGASDVSSFRLVGTQGAVHLEPAFEYAEPLVYTLTLDGKTTKKRGKKRDQFAAELLHFSDCVLKDRAPEPSAEEGAQDVRIVEALYESARQGRAIALVAVYARPRPPASTGDGSASGPQASARQYRGATRLARAVPAPGRRSKRSTSMRSRLGCCAISPRFRPRRTRSAAIVGLPAR